MGDQSGNPNEGGGAADDAPSVSTSADETHHPPALVGERVADAQDPQQEFNPSAFPHQPNQPGYHMQSPYNQADPYVLSGMRQALPDYATPAPYGFQQYQNQPLATVPVVSQVQYPQNASYGPPIAFGSPYPPQYGQRSPVAGQFDQNIYQYYQDAYGRPSGSPTVYMQRVPQFHQPAMQAGPRPSGSGQQHAARGALGGLADETRESLSSIPRGPPRKPKQSGHALWVGNLPTNTSVAELKDNFSKDATKDIASVFLISKSNCAFVNYRTEEACNAAVQRFNESLFKGLRLVCRQRKSSNAGVGAPPGTSQRDPGRPERRVSTADDVQDKSDEAEDATETIAPRPQRPKDRFFIVKSLTVQDLEQSVRNGIWATQTHNESSLNEAYESADNVYLIFSANKSGEYFGFARMASPIVENAAEPPIQRTTATYAGDAPKTIFTPATAFAPKGRITDDSARGTIFWEAELSDGETDEDAAPEADDQAEDTLPETWGKPFKVEWMSTNRLPFYRTRGLRNAWNANREVKIARDGTELEPGVGRQLVDLIQRNLPHLSR